MARQLTENQDDMVDAEEEMYFEEIIITCDYSDYDIVWEEKEIITESIDILVKIKTKYEQGEYFYSLLYKKRG